MRYSEGHKQETRKKVVRAAAAAVRAKGPEAVSVAEVMAEAGLTHGGFYAHFQSKEALVVAALEEAFDQSRRRFGRLTAGMSDPEALAAFVDAYVSSEHRLNPHRGCPIATVTSDLPRQTLPVRQAFESGIRSLIARLSGWLPDTLPEAGDPTARESLAASLLAEMAGAVLLSRALSDDAAAERLLADSRRSIKARMGLSPEVQA